MRASNQLTELRNVLLVLQGKSIIFWVHKALGIFRGCHSLYCGSFITGDGSINDSCVSSLCRRKKFQPEMNMKLKSRFMQYWIRRVGTERDCVLHDRYSLISIIVVGNEKYCVLRDMIFF